ncbi:MAG: transposase zinc-binding domain-containing protein [Deltaproteobacteria bacterium]|nr:transposase zinc-binding domain-containing protein [Deltaproteobacteria bacterium]
MRSGGRSHWVRVAEYERRQPERTLLHRVISEQLESFLAKARERCEPVAYFVERELRAYLECGVLAHGFLRVHCDGCGHDRLVAFSCKGRGFCPSCGGRRMADTAACLVDRVLPEVPVRQWVLTLPSQKETANSKSKNPGECSTWDP